MEALTDAIRNNDIDRVASLLDSGEITDIDEAYDVLTPLCEACHVNARDIALLLLSSGASVNAPSKSLAKQPLHFACDTTEDRVNLIECLLEAGCDINAQDEDGNTALHLACTHSNVEATRLLLSSGADVTLEDVDEETALLRSCYAGEEPLIQMLLEHGSDPAQRNGTCLLTCILQNKFKGVYMLFKLCPDLELTDVLMLTASKKMLESRTHLLDQGTFPQDVETTAKLPPLHITCSNPLFCPSYKVIVSILEVRNDVHKKDYAGYLPLQYACSTVNLHAVQVLLAYGANSLLDGWTPLWKFFPSPMLHNFQDYFLVLKLLMLSGFKMEEESFRMFCRAAEDCTKFSTGERRQFVSLVTQWRLLPLGLKELCRVKLRQLLPANVDKCVEQLQLGLPQCLVRYLLYEDVVPPLLFDFE
ncbi:serine/threonine-protein phosphatase 6 regulatory ankyrin repeat subunit B-like isoform X2 [Haliotis asinina]|uniref:serine/threonine-protein phosphatase 6 regulatory ankyrin repeat subunit B-like isoform X2 n=1 Tax=Haliotis asinina TaxID=109174 RepID=UPI003532019D